MSLYAARWTKRDRLQEQIAKANGGVAASAPPPNDGSSSNDDDDGGGDDDEYEDDGNGAFVRGRWCETCVVLAAVLVTAAGAVCLRFEFVQATATTSTATVVIPTTTSPEGLHQPPWPPPLREPATDITTALTVRTRTHIAQGGRAKRQAPRLLEQ
jgi:hypothetical protein